MIIFILMIAIVAGNALLWALNVYNDISPQDKKEQDKRLSIFGE